MPQLTEGRCSPYQKQLGAVQHPYALYHQTHPRESPFDMSMHLAIMDSIVYPDQYGTDVPDTHSDLIETVLHEMLHGLGMISRLIDQNKQPVFNYFKTGPQYNIVFSRSLFDTHLYTDHDSISEIYNGLDMSSTDASAIRTHIDRTIPRGLGKIKAVLNSTRAIFFNTTRGSSVFVENGLPQDKLVSFFSHLSEATYRRRPDDLMVYSAGHYGAIPTKLNLGAWPTAPFGNLTLELLETLGYTRNPEPSQDRSQLEFIKQMFARNKT